MRVSENGNEGLILIGSKEDFALLAGCIQSLLKEVNSGKYTVSVKSQDAKDLMNKIGGDFVNQVKNLSKQGE